MPLTGARERPASSGGDDALGDGPVVEGDDLVVAGDGEFVQALAVDEPGVLGAEGGECFGHGAGPGRVKHAGQLVADAGGVREWAEQVEDGAGAELHARAGGVAQGRVVAGVRT